MPTSVRESHRFWSAVEPSTARLATHWLPSAVPHAAASVMVELASAGRPSAALVAGHAHPTGGVGGATACA